MGISHGKIIECFITNCKRRSKRLCSEYDHKIDRKYILRYDGFEIIKKHDINTYIVDKTIRYINIKRTLKLFESLLNPDAKIIYLQTCQYSYIKTQIRFNDEIIRNAERFLDRKISLKRQLFFKKQILFYKTQNLWLSELYLKVYKRKQ